MRSKKRWLKRKGCKNVALVDHQRYHEDGEPYTVTTIEPYYKGKPFTYISKVYKGQQTIMHNVYFKDGNLIKSL